MKNILVPIDFSKNSKHAANYALMVAKQLNAHITFLYINAPSIVPEYNLPPGMDQYLSQNQLEAINDLQEFVADVIKTSKLPADRFSQKTEIGFISERIIETAQSIKANLIIMGTKGVSDNFDRWIGTTSQKVMKISECPVWIIPEKASINFPKKFVYAADFQKDELSTKHKIINIVSLFNAKCNVIHVIESRENTKDKNVEILIEPLIKNIENDNISIVNSKGTDTIDGLKSYLKANPTDVLILAHYEKPFLLNIFQPSVTKHFVQNATLPILVISKNNNLFMD